MKIKGGMIVLGLFLAVSGNALAAPILRDSPSLGNQIEAFGGSLLPVTPHAPTETPIAFQPLQPTPTALVVEEPVRLTEAGCCAYPMWSKDSQWVIFLDKPNDRQPAGLYGVPVEGGERTLIHARVGTYSLDRTLVAYPEDGRMFVERWADGTRWVIPSEGRMVRFSPSAKSVAWEVTSRGIQFPDVRQKAIWVSSFEGTNAHEVVTVNGGEFLGWEQEENAFIVTGRLGPAMPSGIWRVDVASGAGRLLLEVERPLSPLLSPNGEWVAYQVAFEQDADKNGLWVVRSDGSEVKKLAWHGAYRWRSESVLLVIPFDLDDGGPSLWQVEVQSGEMTRLTNPDHTPLPIANNDWEASPDGKRIAYVSFEDRSIYVLRLPKP